MQKHKNKVIEYFKSFVLNFFSKSVKKEAEKFDAVKMACTQLLDRDFYVERYPDIAAADVDPLAHYIECGFIEGRWPLSITSVDAESRIQKALEYDPLNSMAVKLNLMLSLGATDLDAVKRGLAWFKDGVATPELIDFHRQLIEDSATSLFITQYRNSIKISEIQSILNEFHDLLPQSNKIKAALALTAFRLGRLEHAGSLLAELSAIPPGFEDIISQAAITISEAKKVNADVPCESRILLLDSSFPSKVSSFRYGEFKSYLHEIDECSIQVLPDDLTRYGESLPFHQQVEQFKEVSALASNRIRYFDTDCIGSPKVAYCVFLNLADYFYTQVGLPSAEHLLFTLYPGGGFNLNDKVSDRKLRQLCDNPKLSKIITTQNVSYRYLVDGGFCESDRIQHIYGGIIPSIYSMDDQLSIAKDLNKPLDVCFVAQKYSATGAEKGYDVFVDVVKKFANSADIRFHVVGGFDNKTIDFGDIRNISFYGARPASFFDNFYTSMDLILSPNIHVSALDPNQPESFDGFPTTAVVEAGLRGVAVFLTDFKNMNCNLDGSAIFKDNEMKVIDRNPESISHLMQGYLSDREALMELGQNGRRAILRQFGYEVQMRPRIELLKNYFSTTA
ncbi:glycosyltransferase family protein [Pseudomonas atacamensis]|uniref:hypothetical protein n=1 Tax=Pseudomonas atacamensis TaxID=2565368 RepID=UPI0021D89D40|nr:hypothetical protein [Pseudomonas atacamensis]